MFYLYIEKKKTINKYLNCKYLFALHAQHTQNIIYFLFVAILQTFFLLNNKRDFTKIKNNINNFLLHENYKKKKLFTVSYSGAVVNY